MAQSSKNKKQMSPREQAKAIWKVAKLSFKASPGAVLFKLAGAVVNALLPLATAYFAALTTTALVGAYNGEPDAQRMVIIYVIATAALGLVSIVWSSIDQYIRMSMSYAIESKVSDQMYEHFLSLDFWRYDDKETADLYDKAQKFSRFFSWIFDRLASIISQLITMIAGVAALMFVNVWLALIVFIAIIPGVYFQFKLSRAQVNHWNENVNTRRARNYIEWDLLQVDSIAELRLYGIVRYLLDMRATLRDKDEKERIEFEKKYIAKRLGADALQTAAEVGSLVWITLEIIAHAQPVGQFVYVQQVVSRAISGANGFITELNMIDEDVANLFEYERFMQLEHRQEGNQTVAVQPEKIHLRDISFTYPSQKKPVLHHVNLTINRGEHVAIVGENGAGKSTLVKLLTGLYRPTKGSVEVDDVALSDLDIASWHRLLGVLQQDFTKYNFANARDNVLFGDVNKTDMKQLHVALDEAEASKFTSELPQGLDSYIHNWMEDDDGNKGKELSGGQWQRLALARNFYRDAPIIILDEPTSAIDALAESRIFERLFKEKDKTIITISHRLSTVKKADVIYVMKDGRIVESGTADELIAAHGEFYHMFASQL